VVRGDLAYVAMATGLAVMDISQPTSPQQIGELFLSGIPQQLVVEDSFAYVLSWGSGVMHIVDVSNPLQPVRRGGFAAGEFAYCITVRSQYVYLGIPNVPAGILRIVNATNPDLPTFRDTTLGFIGRTATTVDTLLLIGATPTIGSSRSFKVFSVAEPAYPRLLGEVVIPGRSGNTGGISVVGTKAYLAVLDTGVVEVDIANPSQPQIQRVLNRKPLFAAAGITSVSGIGMAPMGDHLLVPYYTGLLTVSKAQSDSLREVSFFPTGGTGLDVAVKSNIAYVASEFAGLWILDVSDPTQPQSVSNVQNGGSVSTVVVSDTLVYVVNTPYVAADSTRGIWIANASDIMQPHFLSRHVGISNVVPSYMRSNPVALVGALIIAGQTRGGINDSTVEIVDATDPRNPQQVGIIRGRYSLSYISAVDSILYIATIDSGIIIVDVRDVALPERIGSVLQRTVGLVVKDTLLYATAGPDSLYVLTVSNPRSPSLVGTATIDNLNSFEQRLAASGKYLYLTKRYLGLIDVQNPGAPVEKGIISLFHSAISAAPMENKVLATDASLGLWLLRNDLITSVEEGMQKSPVGFHLDQNYPNPFNPGTRIRFQLSDGGPIRLEIFDVLGQKIRTLIDQPMNMGSHSVWLDGSQLPSGVYFYRLKSGTGSQTRRMILIK